MNGFKFTFSMVIIRNTSFLSVPAVQLVHGGINITYSRIMAELSNPDILRKAQTFAFTTLSISELFHAIGTRNVRKSIF